MSAAVLLEIHLAPEAGAAPRRVAQAEAVAGVGLAGDRYAARRGTWSARAAWWNEVTLIEAEVIEAARAAGVELAEGAHRRNLVTHGVRLEGLIGREFRIGAVVLRGERPCDPCRYLDEMAAAGARAALLGRGGLRASIVRGGELREGAVIELLGED